ncbi:TetR/AcrR family transcriptional regulator [Corticibacter populi]|uniref:TetR/AcrR family transcriptional regulator n=1 Tax=Corticibacter populi TaxID=1550736 RepID=A0A3M6QRZ0_9BURK|nr:TetR/AcrR family transcriptional regulator [Corticibacter populi]RMX05810.1 TetR/AcrR family transcriptional regulator [Corticibacter populi]RZS30879.1 TetR family transcriptional regulator [Corticibacter populi]
MGITSATPPNPTGARRQRSGRKAAITPPPRPDVPPDTGRQRHVSAATDAQRERILQAATRLFAAQGYANTTIAQIAAELGVTKPFVYYYFHDKQALFETLSWHPAVACFSALDFADGDPRPAVQKVQEGLARLIRATIAHYPAAFFPYKEPQAYRTEYQAAVRQLANRFYDRLCPLLEQARADGDLAFGETRLTALAACSLPGFLYSWYRPDGRLGPEAVTAELTRLAMQLLGLRPRAPATPPSAPGG